MVYHGNKKYCHFLAIFLIAALTFSTTALSFMNPVESALPEAKVDVVLSVQDSTYEIYLMDRRGESYILARLTNNSANDEFPAFSPDGTWIAFDSNRDGNYEIYFMDRRGESYSLTRLTNNASIDEYPAYSPDGTWIAFDSNRDGNYEIYFMDRRGESYELWRLTNNIADDKYPDYSPDGNWVVFQSNRDGNNEIYEMDRRGESYILSRLTYNSANDEYPAYSPDGNWITFQTNRDGNYEIYLMDRRGEYHNLTRLTYNSASDLHPSWSTDGTKIIFQSNRDGNYEIYYMDYYGEIFGITRYTNNASADANPVYSPDGNWIAFQSNRDKWKQNSTLTAQSSAYSVVNGSSVTLSGSLSPVQPGSVTIYRSINNNAFVSIGSATLSNGAYSFQTILNDNGTYRFYTYWAGNENYTDATSSTISINVTVPGGGDGSGRQNSELTIQSSDYNVVKGSTVTLSGSLSPVQAGSIMIYRSINDSAFIEIGSAPLSNGAYSFPTLLNDTGTYRFYTYWAGNENYFEATSSTVYFYIAVTGSGRQHSSLTILSSAYTGTSVTLSGALSPAQPGSVTIYRSINDSAFISIGTATLSNGAYSFPTLLNDNGTYRFNAYWAGNENYTEATSGTVYFYVTGAIPAAGIDPFWIVIIVLVLIALIATAGYFIGRK